MKKLFTLLLFVAFAFTVSAQITPTIANDTVASDTVTLYSATPIPYYSGVAGYVFTADTANASPTVYFQGSYGSNWYTISSEDNVSGVKEFLQTPPKYVYYRIYVPGESGDTLYLTNIRFVYKLPKLN